MHKNKAAETISNEIWDRYQETKNLSLRNKILTSYLYIVTINAKRMSAIYKDKAELEDIVNHGVIALIECIERYDWRRGVQFDTFASIRIRGSIIDYLRKNDWIPRDIRKMSIQIENAYMDLQTLLNRQPTDEEVAQSIGLDLNDFHKITSQTNGFFTLSYEELLNESYSFKEPESSIKAPEQNIEEDELKNVIASSIDILDEKERLIVSLYYYEELKLKEIAAVLGITASRVSQIHTRALLKMKKTLGDYMRG